jgi:A/G-specific adenine glycosylase
MQIHDKHIGDKQRHTFSHYNLDYTPLFIETNNAMDLVQETDTTVWHNTEQFNKIGLAAPIKTLLQQHFKKGKT